MKLFAAVVPAVLSPTGLAAYPDKPVRIILPYSPGGAGDIVLRTLQPTLERRLGQQVVIEYRPGAAGNIGAMEVVRAPADGYTLLMGPTNQYVINQHLFPKMGFDPLTAFAPISVLVDHPYLVAISAAVPAQTFAEFARYAKANPGKLNFGSAGNATVPHLSGLMLSDLLEARMVHVPFKGSQPGLQSLVTNDIQLFLASYGLFASQLASGKIRALAVASSERLKVLPSLPTTTEVGIPPGVIMGNWWGLAAPAATDQAVINRLASELRAIAGEEDIQRRFAEQGALIIMSSPAEFRERMRTESQAWRGVITRTGAKVDN